MVRCEECNIVHRGSYSKAMCWTRWKLCRFCAIKLHPEAYTVPYVRKVLSNRREKLAST